MVSIGRGIVDSLTLGLAPFPFRRDRTHSGYAGSWRGHANLPTFMSISAVDLRLVVRPNGHATCLATATWTASDARAKVRGRGWIYASGRCVRWNAEQVRPRVVVHTIARLAAAASHVTFDLYLPDGSELFGSATLRTDSPNPKTAF